ncbi:hypothetical protein V6N12_004757 [Hibiscus sabdariffa]|uniref:Pectinesterase n=1 Tax=Hibiscus sabdariffa TaxID=183260 RepID=A0ABR2CMF4_9ROSI
MPGPSFFMHPNTTTRRFTKGDRFYLIWINGNYNSEDRRTAFFGVYKCLGPGAAAVRGVSWAKELEFEEAHPFLAKSFVNGRHWIAPWDA